jgi:hypothetical protein
MPGIISGIIGKIAGDKAADIVTSVGEVADKFITTGQEKEEFKAELTKEVNRHIEALSVEQNKELETIIKDMDSARNREIQIATSDKVPKLNKLITPILGLFVTVGFFGLLTLAAYKAFPPENERMLDIMTGSLGTAWIGIVMYYFGSSASSSRKQDSLDKMMSK